MILIRRRLFWKIYFTLLVSLVAVTALMGGLWWLVGGGPHDPWGPFHIHLTDNMIPQRDNPPGAIANAVELLGQQIGADISVYSSDGRLIASGGEPVMLAMDDGEKGRLHRTMRIDLPDGRSVLARLRLPPHEPGLRILMIMLVVAGGVGLAAFPMTARLTRQLERLRSGVARWGAGSLSVRLDDTGIDEVAHFARTFNAAAERVEALLTSQKVLLANASHELRSPLARLRVANEILLEQPTAQTHAEIVHNLLEIDQLVDEILLASRLDHAGPTIGPEESVDLLGLAAEEAVRAGATLAGSRVELNGDTRLLRRLIRNLLDNAAKHGRPPIQVSVTSHGNMARVIVSDQGDGIAPAERERVFEPFYRPTGRSEASGGWGLGLSLVRQIAARHGGTVSCEPEAGGGNRFIVHLAMTRHLDPDQLHVHRA